MVSGSMKKLLSIDCVNIYFSQSIVNYLLPIFFSIDLKVLGHPTLLISWFIVTISIYTNLEILMYLDGMRTCCIFPFPLVTA